MTINENADVIRLYDTEANLIAGSKMRPGMIAMATDTNRIVRKRLSDSAFHYWSDDTKQLLLAGAQTVTGNKTWSGTNTYNGVITVNELATLSNELVFTPKEISVITDGVTNLDTSNTCHIKITKDDSTPTSQTCGLTAGTTYGQILLVETSDRSGIEIDDSVSGSAFIILEGFNKLALLTTENALFVWTEKIDSANDYWNLLSTNGALS